MKTHIIEICIERDRKKIEQILRMNLSLMNMNEDMCQEIADVILCELMGILDNKGKLKQRSKR
jgi:hypothetical protein